MSKKCSYVFKILLIGDSGVGKSSLLTRYAEDSFEDAYRSTIGVNYRVRTITVEEKTAKLQMWDTAGQERFRAVTACCFRGADGVILVYDTTREETFKHIPLWLDEVDRYAPKNVNKLLIGNKADLTSQRAIDSSYVKAFSDQKGITFIETSAKDSVNVDLAFFTMASDIKRRMQEMQERRNDASSAASSAFRLAPATARRKGGGEGSGDQAVCASFLGRFGSMGGCC